MNTPPPSEETLFAQALAFPAVARAIYLEQVCAGQPALRERLESLLRAHDRAGSLLEGSPGRNLGTVLASAEEMLGNMIGRYKLLQKIGEGGCGVVYMAEQEEPVRRRVALKVIKLGMDTKSVIARFEAERQALAMMDHSNIAKVFDAGATDTGRPFFVMELVRGIPITKYCDEANLSTAARLELFTQVCHAIQHAHQKGIIHRDIKPSNVLVTVNDGKPVPKVIDFGIAKATQGRLTDSTLFTAFEQFIGTPAYMSPEQAAMTSLDIDTRSDIYSLGVLLYEILTGRPPFDPKTFLEAGLDEMRRIIREVEPPKPSTRLSTLTDADRNTVAKLRGSAPAQLSTLLRGDLDWIVMRCLEKDRTRRYESAGSLALDLQHHLRDEPVAARPPSTVYLLQKLVRRHRVACATGAAVLVALIVGLAATGWAYVNERDAHRFAVEATRLHLKASETNQTIMIENGRLRRESEGRAKVSESETAKNLYALPLLKNLVQIATAGQPAASDRAQLRQLLDPLTKRMSQDSKLPPTAKQELGEIFGDFYAALNDLPEAEAMYRQTLALRRELLGDADPATATALEKLIDVLKRQGKDAAAAQTRREAHAQLNEYLHSERRAKELRTQSREQSAAGNYTAAEASLTEAIAITRFNLREKYDLKPDLGELARLKFSAGDLHATKQLATEWVMTEKTTRQWRNAGSLGFFSQNSYNVYTVPYDGYTLLGLVALHDGDKTQAGEYLLKSVNGITPGAPMGKREIELAASLLAAGDQATVVQFLDKVRQRQAVLENRGFTIGGFTFDWRTYYYHAAAGREIAMQLDHWRLEASEGEIPADWQKMLHVTPQEELVTLGRPATFASRTSEASHSLPSTPWTLLPFSVLMLGWCTTALATRLNTRWTLPSSPSWWLAAFCVARTVDCALFTATILLDGFDTGATTRPAVSVVSWLLLWAFVRSLVPAEATRGEIITARISVGIGILALCAVEVIGFLIKNDAALLMEALGILGLILLMISLAIAVSIVAGRRLWKWSRRAELGGPRWLSLKIASVMLMAHGYVSIFLPQFCDSASTAAATTALWLNALLPWLLLLGFTRLTADHPGQSTPAPIAS